MNIEVLTPTRISEKKIYDIYCDHYDSIHYLFVEFQFSWLQPKLQLTTEEVMRYSPLLNKPSSSSPVLLAVGADESSEFHRQSEKYAEYLINNGISTKYISVKGKNHFNIIDSFLGDGGIFCEKILEWSH